MNIKEYLQQKRQYKAKVAPVRLKRLISVAEAEVLAKMVEGVPPSAAVVSAGYDVRNPQHAASIGKAIWKKHSDENGELVTCLEKHGVSFDSLAQRIKDGLSATKTKNVKVNGDWVEVDVVDHQTRHKFLETAIRVRNADPPKKIDITTQTFESKLFEIIGKQQVIEDAEVINGDS
jgi:hypothetical protein